LRRAESCDYSIRRYNAVVSKQPIWVWFLLSVLIVGILVIAWPITAGDRQRDPKSGCLSNVKVLSLGLVMYSVEYDDRLPSRDHWMDLAEGVFSKKPNITPCPRVVGPGLFGYAFNAGLTKLGGPSDDKIPLVYDSVNLARNASDLVNSLPMPGRHKGNNVIGYADGHVRAVKSSLPTKP
jgi:prepilin-type processing-associated H-X9-DG protein